MARSNSLDFRPATVDIYARPGQDLTWRVSVSDEGITAGTITCDVGGQTPTVDTSLSSTGLLVADITLTDTQTTALGATSVAWSLSNTVAGVTTPYLCGTYIGSTVGNSSNGLNASVVATTGHAAVQTLVSTSAATALAAHLVDTTSVHGITDTSALYRAGGTDVAIADGGTGASTASAARVALGAVAASNLDAAAQFTLGSRSQVTTLPAASFRPTAATSLMAVDVMPTGSPTEDPSEGFAWLDICSTDIRDNLDPTTCAHVGVGSIRATFGSRGYGGSTAPNLWFEVGAGNTNGMSLDSSGTLSVTGSVVVPFIRSAVGQPIIDLRTSGTILLKSAAAADKPCVLRAVASQSGSMLEVQAEDNSVHIKISNGHTAKYPELVAGMNALPLAATSGYFHAPSCAGTPTGTPQTHGSSVPIVIDTTGSKLWARIGGTWKSTTLA